MRGSRITTRSRTPARFALHDLGGFHYQVMGIYLDDCASGVEVHGNVLLRAGSALHLGGGREVSVLNNLFVDCRSAVHVDARGASAHRRQRDRAVHRAR